MTVEGVDLSTIGIFTLVGLPYTWKFLWAPLMDRYVPPFLGRRRGWLLVTQLALAAGIAAHGVRLAERRSRVARGAGGLRGLRLRLAGHRLRRLPDRRREARAARARGRVHRRGLSHRDAHLGRGRARARGRLGVHPGAGLAEHLPPHGRADGRWGRSRRCGGREPQAAAPPPRTLEEAVWAPLQGILLASRRLGAARAHRPLQAGGCLRGLAHHRVPAARRRLLARRRGLREQGHGARRDDLRRALRRRAHGAAGPVSRAHGLRHPAGRLQPRLHGARGARGRAGR